MASHIPAMEENGWVSASFPLCAAVARYTCYALCWEDVGFGKVKMENTAFSLENNSIIILQRIVLFPYGERI